jgi:hypothetical protein
MKKRIVVLEKGVEKKEILSQPCCTGALAKIKGD